MIPKILHYCWYGKPLETNWLATKCLATWKKLKCKLMKWDESTCKFNENEYVKKAFENKRWAHLSDYYRLKGVYETGGYIWTLMSLYPRRYPIGFSSRS